MKIRSPQVAQRILYLTAGLSRAAGGPYLSVSELARTIHHSGRSVSVLGVVANAGMWAEDRTQWDKLSVCPMSGSRLLMPLRLSCKLDAALQSNVAVVHANGLWDSVSVACRLADVGRRALLVVSPRGMLEPWALKYHAWRKRAAMLLWQGNLLRQASLFHATSESEADSIRRLGLRQPIAVIPNGVSFAEAMTSRSHTSGMKRCVFLSRLHPKKGLPLLLEAWQAVRPRGWELLIAGYGDPSYVQDLEATIAGFASPHISLVGELRGREKWRFLQAADLFVLPSYSENFGIAVVEAMIAGVPVITTTGTPWNCLKEHGLGWWVPPSAIAIAGALAEATLLSGDTLHDLGRRSSDYVRQHYGWQQIGSRMAECYDWLLGSGPLPKDIVLR